MKRTCVEFSSERECGNGLAVQSTKAGARWARSPRNVDDVVDVDPRSREIGSLFDPLPGARRRRRGRG